LGERCLRSVSHRLVTLLIAGAALLAGCRGETPDPSSQRDVPLFIVSIDTLRSDRLPAYGYTAIETPAITAFRKDAILFEHAFSHVPLTLPSHASLLTGKLPNAHGVRDNLGYRLEDAETTLAETLKSRGYATGAAVSSYVLRRRTGIEQGFDFFDDALEYEKSATPTVAERDGDRSRLALEQWLQGVTGSKVFALLHLYEPHAPYAPPAQFASKDSYDGEVRYADAIFGRFVAHLKSRGLYDDALIVLVSDHGEGLGEHGEDDHGVFVYRESIQVPLLVKLPRSARAGESVRSLASLVDVVPTVLAQLGGESAKSDGIDLLAKDAKRRQHYAESYFARLHLGWSELHALVDDGFHYIDAPGAELYRRDDRTQTANLLATERRAGHAMRAELEKLRVPFKPPTAIDAEDQRKLASLGYLGGAAPSTGPLPDPKDKVALLQRLKRGVWLVEGGQHREAATALRALLAESPEFSDGWFFLGQALRRSGDAAGALDALKNGLRRFPQNSGLALAAADVLASLGRLEEAKAHAELAVRSDPVVAHELLANIAMKRRDVGGAERELRAALSADPARVSTLMLLAETLRRQDRRAEELQALQSAGEAIARRALPPPPSFHFQLGEAFLGAGRPADAVGAFRKEIELHPQHRRAWASLALVLAGGGQRGEARSVLSEAVRRNPDREMYGMALEAAEIMGDAELAQTLKRSRG
jgi:arylsulfatase A-like enzyme/cytochrome c-type biogenesis protein CcmH/NrfG